MKTLEGLPYRWARILAVVLLALQLAFTLFTAKGHFTDSYLYYLETESVVERGELALDVGYDGFRSPALELPGAVEHDGHLFSKYPALYSLITAPFLALFGESGLFFLNSLALLGALFFTIRLARHVCSDERTVWVAIAVLLGGTYFWYYSQAIWPHMLQACLLLGATYAMILDRDWDESWSWRAGAAGALVGVAVGIRLDSVFVLPALGVLALLGSRPFGKLVSLAAGLLPFLGLLSWLNHVKFGRAIPFTYGLPFGADEKIVATAGYVEALVPVMLICGAYLVAAGGGDRWFEERHRTWTTRVLAGLTVVSLAALGEPLFRGLGILLVDMRVLEPEVVESAMARTASGAVTYIDHFKKALLQSAPFLPIATLPLLRPREMPEVEDSALFRWLYLIPASYLIVFCGLRWHGGMAFDMRYLIPTLPFFAILAAGTLQPLLAHLKLRDLVRTKAIKVVAPLLALLGVISVRQHALPVGVREPLFLTVPLVLAAVTFVLVGRVWWRGERLSANAAALLCLPLFWGGPVSLGDYDRQNAWRAGSEEVATRFAPHIPDRSLVLGLQKDLLSKTDDVYFASLREEALPHIPELVRHYFASGRRVFLIYGRSNAPLRDVGLQDEPLRAVPLEPYSEELGMETGGLYELRPVDG